MLKTVLSILTTDKEIFSTNITRRVLVGLQALFGLLWLEGSMWKIMDNGKFLLNNDGLRYWASKGVEYPVLDIYKTILEKFILPNIEIFLILVFIAEFTTGLLFLLGKYVRLASMLAFGQTIAITLSVLNAPNEWKWSYFMMMMFSLLFFVMPTTSRWTSRLKRSK
jgi:thiosulfate dehydrogenase (quinone) large subunit